MSHERRKATQAALEKYLKKDLKKVDKLMGKGKKNGSPEKGVERTCKVWMEQTGIS